MTLWGKRSTAVDALAHPVDERGADAPPPPGPVDGARFLWSTMSVLASGNTLSSTIHTPYYRHCQN